MVNFLVSALRGVPILEGVLVVPAAGRFLLSICGVFFWLALGAAALAASLFLFPDATLQLYRWSRSVGETLSSGSWPAHHERVLRAVADERLIVYMGFVMAARIVVGVVMLLASRWIGARPGNHPHRSGLA
jgi:hypothetical protein